MIENILNSKTTVKILKLLVNRPDWIFIESEIARDSSLPKTTTHRTLKKLLDQNIVRKLKKGNKVNIYRLNTSNYIVKHLIEPFLKKDSEIILEKSKEFCKNIKNDVKAAIIFGSAAAGEMGPTSDIDIALITDQPKIQEKTDRLKLEYLKKEEIIFSTHIFTKKEFKKRYEERNPLVLDIINGKIIIGNIENVI